MNLAEQYLVDITGVGLRHHEVAMLNYYTQHALITHYIGEYPDAVTVRFADTSSLTTKDDIVIVMPPTHQIDWSVLIRRLKL